MQRMTGSEVLSAREDMDLDREDLARLLGNRTSTVRDWESGKTFPPLRLAAQIADLESVLATVTERAVESLVSQLRTMPRPRVLVYAENERPQHGDVARYGLRWWRHVAMEAKDQLPEARIGTQAEFDAMDDEP